MSAEFGLAGIGAEHVEDWLECFRTECHRRPQQVVVSVLIQVEPNIALY